MNQNEILAACDRALELDAKATPAEYMCVDNWDNLTLQFLKSREGRSDAKLIQASRTFAPSAARWILAAIIREAAKDRALEAAKVALEKIAGKTPGKFPAGTGVGLAVSHEKAAAAALAAIKEVQP